LVAGTVFNAENLFLGPFVDANQQDRPDLWPP